MAAPDDVTMHNLSGNWVLKKIIKTPVQKDPGLSSNLEEAIAIQGIPYLVRKVMLLATIGETITETTDSAGTKGFIVNRTIAGLKGRSDSLDGTGKEVVLDRGSWSLGSSSDKDEGPKGRILSWSWWLDLSSSSETPPKHPGTGDLLDGYLLEDWILDGVDSPGPGGPGHTTHFAGSGEKDDVRDCMVWGFCRIGGKRYRAVKYHARKGDREVRARMVYAWAGRM